MGHLRWTAVTGAAPAAASALPTLTSTHPSMPVLFATLTTLSASILLVCIAFTAFTARLAVPSPTMSAPATVPRVILLTGATGIIGAEIARQLATAHHTLILPVRSASRGQALIDRLTRETGHSDFHLEQVQLEDPASVKALAARVRSAYPSLSVLINNAAVVPTSKETTAQGLELQFATNILSYYTLMAELRPTLKAAARPGEPSRVVNVASNYAGRLDLNDLQFTRRPYNPEFAYRQSKQANRMMSYYAARLYAADNIVVNAVHPGFTSSSVTEGLGFERGTQTAEKSARTPVWAAVSPEAGQLTGEWLVDKKKHSCQWKADQADQKQLWEYCASLSP